MKMLLMLFLLVIRFSYSNGQTAGDIVAQKISQKMRDSLSLTENQRARILLINKQLLSQKTEMRQQYSQSDSLSVMLQRVENNRDSLYHSVLTESQFTSYRQRKKNIVNNN